MQRLEWQKKAYHVVLIKVIQCAKKYLQSKALNNQYSHAGRLDISAVTAQGIPKFERAPLMIPHGKYRCMLVACAALFSAGGLSWDKSPFSGDGSTDIRASQRNRLSCKTNVPYQKKKKIHFLKFTQKHIIIIS